jgi:hypothetical protein
MPELQEELGPLDCQVKLDSLEHLAKEVMLVQQAPQDRKALKVQEEKMG